MYMNDVLAVLDAIEHDENEQTLIDEQHGLNHETDEQHTYGIHNDEQKLHDELKLVDADMLFMNLLRVENLVFKKREN